MTTVPPLGIVKVRGPPPSTSTSSASGAGAVWAGNRGTISEKRRLSTVRAEIPPLPGLEWVLILGTSFLGQLYAAIARPKPLGVGGSVNSSSRPRSSTSSRPAAVRYSPVCDRVLPRFILPRQGIP